MQFINVGDNGYLCNYIPHIIEMLNKINGFYMSSKRIFGAGLLYDGSRCVGFSCCLPI
jgi:hypothetical protein